ncbi:hypothetical protein MBLNU230_g3865t1 [Neophaeotheca triangularis]
MRSFTSICAAAGVAALSSVANAGLVQPSAAKLEKRTLEECVVKPKVFIVSMFESEAEPWYNAPDFDILAMNITVPGFSSQFPDAHCTADGEICLLTTAMGEINAAVTLTSLTRSSRFDLTSTYFLIAGISGINPNVGTLGDVAFARYAVQVALQYEIDPREVPENFSTGYIPFGAEGSGQYPQSIYGSEVYELNQNLQDLAVSWARTATLNDTTAAQTYRANYASEYSASNSGPCVRQCDVATSDVYYHGNLLSSSFDDYFSLITNGSGTYCTSAQEDNATLEALLRGAMDKLVDFSRIILMRTASNFDRPYSGQTAVDSLLFAESGGFGPAVENIYRAGIPIIEGIMQGWNTTFAQGVNATNYVGDVLGSLGGEPNFGPYGDGNVPVTSETRKRSAMAKRGLPVR